jgi:formylglycine-generating enzyme required for sulfatase activity
MSDQPHDPNASEATGLYDKLTVGSTLGGYTLLEQLSCEGLEQVWRAKESSTTTTDRPLRLTIVHAAAHGSHEALASFRGRATALARLRNHYIDRSFEPQLVSGMDVVVSNVSTGVSLEHWLSEHVELMPVERSRDLFLQLCDALAAAAELPAPYGPLEHRQLRPEHLLVVEAGGQPELRVCGFGLAADTAGIAWRPEDHATDAEAYLAPEQTAGIPVAVTQQTVVFSLAVIAIELLTLRMRPALGRCWWELSSDSDDTTVAALAELRSVVPLPVLKVLSGAMLRAPEARYDSIRTFAAAFDQAWPEPRLPRLQQAQAEATAAARATARPKPPAPAKQAPAPARSNRVAGAVGALVLAAAAAFFALRPTDEPAATPGEGSAVAAAAPTADQPTPPPVAAAAGGSGAVVAAGSGSGAAGAAPEGSAAAPVAATLLPMVNRELGQPCEQSTQCASSLCSNKHCAPEGFAYIPAGSFTRGTPTSELGHKSNEWQTEVVIESPFFLQMAEVSQRDWKAVMESNPSKFTACGDGCPVDSISWWEGAAYLNARSEKEQLTACYQLDGCTGDAKQAGGGKAFACQSATLRDDCTGYRYPTEVEWEYAARAGSTGATYRGNIRLDSTRGFVCGPESALDGIAVWYCGAEARFESGVSGAGHQGPAKIGPARARSRTPNPWGLYDMLGNVAEWTDSAYINSPSEPLPKTAGIVESRVVRGGSWSDPPLALRAGARAQIEATTSSPQRGFRTARRLTIPATAKNDQPH